MSSRKIFIGYQPKTYQQKLENNRVPLFKPLNCRMMRAGYLFVEIWEYSSTYSKKVCFLLYKDSALCRHFSE